MGLRSQVSIITMIIFTFLCDTCKMRTDIVDRTEKTKKKDRRARLWPQFEYLNCPFVCDSHGVSKYYVNPSIGIIQIKHQILWKKVRWRLL
jgi:hypothetical protein